MTILFTYSCGKFNLPMDIDGDTTEYMTQHNMTKWIKYFQKNLHKILIIDAFSSPYVNVCLYRNINDISYDDNGTLLFCSYLWLS